MNEILDKIHSFHEGLSPSKVARKYEFLTENAFRFFRGTNNLFYEDLNKAHLGPSPSTWVCGDLHLENFGSYKGDNRLVYFDINDFDESILAPVNWEIVRMVTSILVGFDALHVTDKEAIKVAEIFLQQYAQILSEGHPKYIEVKTATGIVKKFLNKVASRSAEELLEKRTRLRKGTLELHHHHNKQLVIDDKLKADLFKVFKKWMKSNNAPPNDYKVLDARFRLAGTGSIGIRRYVFLIEKKSDSNRHMLIDMKESTSSALGQYVVQMQPEWTSEAERIITVQKIMQNVPPAQLSSLTFQDKCYVLQELQPAKDRINFKMIEDDFDDLCCVIKDMATLTASAHLRGVGRKGSCTADDLMAYGNNSSWQKKLLDYAVNYKQKVFDDHKTFCNELKK
ncbi:MAG: DUF2252 domain-containing protein [Bacteroidota bacterium]|nr:DUF2252 domain-containing protein [Bacteroidota bacterium]